jgi:hypothetical protein
MSRPAIQSIVLSPNLTLSECHPDSECRAVNWWLYDKRAGMNLGMHAKTKEAALVEAIDYWAERAKRYEDDFTSLQAKVNGFVSQFVEDSED